MNYYELFIDTKQLPKKSSKEEVLILFKKMKQGDMAAKEKLINHNIRLVLACVYSNFMGFDYDKKELVSIGCIGLIKAVDTYDISKGNEFSSYAWKCITNEIRAFLNKLKPDANVVSIDSVVYDEDGDIQLGYVIPSEIDTEDEYIEKDYNRMIYEYYETFEGTRSKGNNVIFWFL